MSYTQIKSFNSFSFADVKWGVDVVGGTRYAVPNLPSGEKFISVDRLLTNGEDLDDPAIAPVATQDPTVYEFDHTYTSAPLYLTQAVNNQTFDCTLVIDNVDDVNKIYRQTVIIGANGVENQGAAPTYFDKKAYVDNIIIDGTTYQVATNGSVDVGNDSDKNCTVIQELTLVRKENTWTCVSTLSVVVASTSTLDDLTPVN